MVVSRNLPDSVEFKSLWQTESKGDDTLCLYRCEVNHIYLLISSNGSTHPARAAVIAKTFFTIPTYLLKPSFMAGHCEGVGGPNSTLACPQNVCKCGCAAFDRAAGRKKRVVCTK